MAVEQIATYVVDNFIKYEYSITVFISSMKFRKFLINNQTSSNHEEDINGDENGRLEDIQDTGIDIFTSLKQIQPKEGWFPKDLHEFLNFYNIYDFPFVNSAKQEIMEESDRISLKDLHDMLQREVDSSSRTTIIQSMQKKLDKDYENMIQEIDSFNIFSAKSTI
uniref:Uncharacterized protein n=1 Tax=Trichobilharzia regenti TaxID=157069 RepID=A0AA85JLM6_TRIRE|nr:unnamed protein product [Trichobilharzia regenti]